MIGYEEGQNTQGNKNEDQLPEVSPFYKGHDYGKET